MNIKIPPPDRPHTAYILRDQINQQHFKIGMSAYPEFRRKRICYEIYGRRSFDKIQKYRSWTCQSLFAALHLEQTAILFLRRLGYEPIRAQDWFEISGPTMDAVIDVVDDLALSFQRWERENAATRFDYFPYRFHDSQYALHLRSNKIRHRELRKRLAYLSSGRYPEEWEYES